jgi:hypothetical protein
MVSELLTSLKLKKNELDLKVSTLTLDITTNNDNCSNKMKDILISKFERIKQVVINRDSIIIQVRSDDNHYTHDVTITNQVLFYNNDFSYNPKIQWSSGSAKRESTTLINYINVVAFVASEFCKEDSEFSKLMEFAWKNVHTKNLELYNSKNELSRIISQIQNEEIRIKREIFYTTLKKGNYYYKVKSNYGRVLYDIIHIDKINPKTIAISMTCTDGSDVDTLLEKMGTSRRIRPYQAFSLLQEYVMFNPKDFKEIVMDTKIQSQVDYVRRQKGLSNVIDIKSLCACMKEFNFITEKIPSNDILHYISKWRHYTLEKNR